MRLKSFFVLILAALIFGALPAARADIDWETSASFTSGGETLDMTSSLNGKYVFILTKGLVTIFTVDGKSQGTIAVDPSFNRISVSGLDLANLDDKIYLSSDSGQVQEISYSFVVNIDTAGAPFLGAANAPITLVVFSDFQ